MTALPAPGVVGDTSVGHTKAELAQELEDIRDWLVESVLGASAVVQLTIASGAVTLPDGASNGGAIYTLETEGAAASDTLTTINLTNTHDGQLVIFMAANASHVVTFDHAAGGTGQLQTWNGQDFAFASTTALIGFRRSGNDWIEIGALRFVPFEDLLALSVSDDSADLLRVWDDSASVEKRISAQQVGRVLQIVHATDAGSSHANTSNANLVGSAKSITPKSANSKFLIECSFAGRVGNVAAVNAAATLSIYETVGTPLSSEYTIEAFSAAGGLGAACPAMIRVRINSTGTSARSFGLQGRVNHASSLVAATNMVWTITEYLE